MVHASYATKRRRSILAGNPLTALARETQAISAVLHELDPADLARATNCPPWNLQELVVHIGATVWVGDVPLPVAESHEEPHSAADYYRRPERSTSSYRQGNVDRTTELARTVVADTSAVQWFDDVADQAIAALGKLDLDQVIPEGAGPCQPRRLGGL